MYDEAGNLLGQYDNGAATGGGTQEIIWLPIENGQSIPVGYTRNNRLYAIHTDHLGTPRRITDDTASVVWQWPISAFADNAPTGLLKESTDKKTNASTLTATNPSIEFNLRYPGQYYDAESKLHYNYFRSYNAGQGRYTQPDPIGLDGGVNRFGYVGGNALSFTDPLGLQAASVASAAPVVLPAVTAACGTGVGCAAVAVGAVGVGSFWLTDRYVNPWAQPLIADAIDWCMESRGRGERGATGGTSGAGTDNPYKHCRNHPTDPNKIICKDHQTGKTVEKKKPADWPK